MRPGGRRADLFGGSRAAGRRPGGGAGLDRGETRRGGSMGRTPLPCREQSRHPRKARVAETGLAAAAGNGTPQPPLRTAARRASRASRSETASPQGPGRDGGLPITTQLSPRPPRVAGRGRSLSRAVGGSRKSTADARRATVRPPLLTAHRVPGAPGAARLRGFRIGKGWRRRRRDDRSRRASTAKRDDQWRLTRQPVSLMECRHSWVDFGSGSGNGDQ